MSKVLVLGTDERSFLAVVRSLGRAGIEVHGGWTAPDAVARASRYLRVAHQLPPYAPGDDAWLRALTALLDAERFDLVVPTSDPTLIPLQLHQAALAPHARLYVLGARAFEVAFDKRKSLELAASLDIRVPREEVFATPADADTVLRSFALPVVLKPRTSFLPTDLGRKRVVRTATDAAALARGLAAFAADGEVLVQERLAGVGAGVELIADQGRVLAAFQHLRVHEPHTGGGSSYRTAVPVEPALGDAAARLMAALDYTGVAMVEFRGDPATSRWAFLEINGRFWGSLPLAIAAGADFPHWLYQLLVEGRRDFPQTYRAGLYCRNWTRDAGWLAENLRAPRAARVPLARVAAEAARVLVGRERSDTFTLDDPRPGLVEAGRLLGRVADAVRARARGVVARLPPVRRAGAARARRTLAGAGSVLFVCKGNICRSPFAEGYARARWGARVRVASSGYFPRADRPAPPEAVDAARELGVDLSAHRSRVLDEGAVRAAGAILVFDEENWLTVARRFPLARGKLHRVADLAPDGPRHIADPYGGSLDAFRTTYRAIARALDNLSA